MCNLNFWNLLLIGQVHHLPTYSSLKADYKHHVFWKIFIHINAISTSNSQRRKTKAKSACVFLQHESWIHRGLAYYVFLIAVHNDMLLIGPGVNNTAPTFRYTNTLFASHNCDPCNSSSIAIIFVLIGNAFKPPF